METQIKAITPETLAESKNIILSGGVVAIPTETVYGLGGNAFDDHAVQKIFEVKGRPNDNPLIAHVHSDYDLSKIIDYDPPYAKKLREAFLPGPLTLVYPSTDKVSRYVSCGLHTLAIRVPSHTGAQAFLRTLDIPIVAPSANLSKHVSPTSAQHVFEDFEGKIPLILDGGECVGGIESTVCDCTGEVPVVLRPGLVTREMIAAVIGECLEYTPDFSSGEKVKSPGLLYKHYAPKCKTVFYPFEEKEQAILQAKREKEQMRVLALCEHALVKDFEAAGIQTLDLGSTEEEMAASLYGLLREAEKRTDVLIAVAPKKQDGIMAGVQNRLKKACASVDIKH